MTAGKSLMFECVCVCGSMRLCTFEHCVHMSVSVNVCEHLRACVTQFSTDYQYRLQISLQATDYSDFRPFTVTDSTLTSWPTTSLSAGAALQIQCLGQRAPALQMDSSAPAQTRASGPANIVGGEKMCGTLHLESMVTSAALSIYKCPSIWVEP